MILISVSLVVSCVLLLLVAAAARSRFGIEAACGLSGAAACLFLFLFSAVLFLQALLTFVAVLVCRRYSARPGTVVLASGATMLLSYAVVLSLSFSELRERVQLRKEFPVISVAERLEYETKAVASGPSRDESKELPLSSDVERQLIAMEGRHGSNIRSHMLASLHDRTRDEFVVARGFGPVRMLGVRRERIELPEPEPVPLPHRPEPSHSPETGTALPLADAASDERLPQRDELLSLHTMGLLDFLSPERMGYASDRHHVTGFQSHQFSSVPELLEEGKGEWQIVRLDLVSLLKYEQPVAYVSEHLPRMDELRNAPTRPLDLFEQLAIDRLRSDEDLVIEDEVNRIRMIGSIRAGRDCLECHSVRRGELLGAFSYELVPMKPVPVPKPPDGPVGPQARTSADMIAVSG